VQGLKRNLAKKFIDRDLGISDRNYTVPNINYEQVFTLDDLISEEYATNKKLSMAELKKKYLDA
jgi:hypothetical protein